MENIYTLWILISVCRRSDNISGWEENTYPIALTCGIKNICMNGYRTNNMYKNKLSFNRKMCEHFNYHSMAKMWDVKCTPSKQNTVTSFLYVIKTRRIYFTIVWHRGKQKQKYRNKTKPKILNKQKFVLFFCFRTK